MRTRFLVVLIVLAALTPGEPTQVAAFADASSKLDVVLNARSNLLTGQSRVIIRSAAGVSLPRIASLVQLFGGQLGRKLDGVSGQVAIVPNGLLRALAANPLVARISLDRDIVGVNERTGVTVGATAIRQQLGYDGAGIGIAIVDSGVTAWHDDLTDDGLSQRVVEFEDFVAGQEVPYDDYGHGTHVAGILAGNGLDSDGARTGIAPGAHILALKVLDSTGRGHASDVIAAIDHAINRRAALNIRIINLSVATGVYESYTTDPLTLAAQRAVAAGITVIAAAGNNGRTAAGRTQYGGITSPGNAPWVLTVGASSHMGTTSRADDTIARFTSRGPTAVDRRAKPDLVAPGVGIESLSDPHSALYTSSSSALLPGTRPTSYLPYLSMSGTSMAAPVVSGTVALMLQANPTLTPNAIKAILQYTAEVRPAHDPLTEGAGFLNSRGAVDLARHLANPSSVPYPNSQTWGARLIWGNSLVSGGRITLEGSAWPVGVTWGTSIVNGKEASWGVRCSSLDCTSTTGPWRIGHTSSQNVVWGSICGGTDCSVPWTIQLITAAEDGETVVWGTDDGETVVWGTDDGETVVWGTDEGETVVWGTACRDESCAPVAWGPR
jgi:serine protease AprX